MRRFIGMLRAFLYRGLHIVTVTILTLTCSIKCRVGYCDDEIVKWSPRAGSQAIVWKDNVLIFGGYNVSSATSYNNTRAFDDIWTTSDGLKWTCVLKEAPWGKRYGYKAIYVSMWDSLCILGGALVEKTYDERWRVYASFLRHTNDVWSTTDVKSWIYEYGIPWEPRINPSAFVYHDKLYIDGGSGFKRNETVSFSDTWRRDEDSWTSMSLNLPQQMEGGFHEFVVRGGILFMFNSVSTGGETSSTSVWKSEDLTHWTLLNAKTPWSRTIYGLCLHQGEFYVMGGGHEGQGISYNDVWKSTDGISWKRLIENSPWKARQYPAVVSFKDNIWLMGGMVIGDAGKDDYPVNDVWTSPDGLIWHQIP